MNRILVGLDGSTREKSTLDAAARLATKMGAKLVLFRSVGLPHDHDLPADAYAMAPDEIMKTLEQRAHAGLDKAASMLPPELLAGIRVIVGVPWQAIGRAAKEESCDLIVIGSHGYDTMDRLIGTTAAKVVNHAEVSVLVVRACERL